MEQKEQSGTKFVPLAKCLISRVKGYYGTKEQTFYIKIKIWYLYIIYYQYMYIRAYILILIENYVTLFHEFHETQ